MTIMLSPDLEARLREAARRQGLDPSDYAARLLEQHLPEPAARDGGIDVLRRWEAEHATDDPAEIARRQREGDEFMSNLARNREESEGPGARKLWP